MVRETKATDRDDAPGDPPQDEKQGLDGQLLSDLSVNVVPIGIIAAFTLLFLLLSPEGAVGDSVLLFHAALIGGVVIVSAIAGWAIGRNDSPLEGSATRSYDAESDRE